MSQTESGFSKKRILAVDDTAIILTRISDILRNDFDVITVNSGARALRFLEQEKPDLILLDYLMPVHNGAAVLKDIQSRVETKNIPVFFLTGQTDADTIRECLALHPAGYIVKPVAKTALLDKMKEVLG